MKKILSTFLILFFCSSLFSLPIGNPAEPTLFPTPIWTSLDCWKFRGGYYGDFVFNRNLCLKDKSFGQGKVIQKSGINTNAGYLVLNYLNHIETFATIGNSKIRIETDEISWLKTGKGDGTLFTDSHLSWSAGARASCCWRCFNIGLEGQYFRSRPKLTQYFSLSNGGLFNYFNKDNKTTYTEWQVGGGISYKAATCAATVGLIPYIGLKWSRVHFNTNDFQFVKAGTSDTFTIFNLASDKRWGYAVGATLTISDKAGITVEGRFEDEKALYINGEICF